MAKPDSKSGFCSKTKIFNSLRPPSPLPSSNTQISIFTHISSLFQTSSSTLETTALIDSSTNLHLSYSQFFNQIQTLSSSLQTLIGLSKGDTALILSPNSHHIPILYLSLLSLGVIISPCNPSSTKSELSRAISLSKPVIAFATSDTSHKLPSLHHQTILLDSPQFHSYKTIDCGKNFTPIQVIQNDLAAVLYSSGTTGRVKGVMLNHRNFIATVVGTHSVSIKREFPAVVLTTVPHFHVYGLVYILKSVAIRETMVIMDRFNVKKMMKVVENYKVTHIAVAPTVVVGMLKSDNMNNGYDLSSLEVVACGGAPLGKEMIQRFNNMFPKVLLAQAYGLTETTAGVFRTVGSVECSRLGATGRLVANCEAKIVDPVTGVSMSPCKHGELWIRGPMVMKGYVGDKEATSEALDPDGWLRTGDLCYIDNDGYLFIVDRIKELIKYKGYQVAPAELEQLLQSHPDIVDAAVIPYPDEEAGQVPMAFVVRHPQSSLNEVQFMEFVAKQVAPYKKIRRVSFTRSIPRNAGGKILRKDLMKLTLSKVTAKL